MPTASTQVEKMRAYLIVLAVIVTIIYNGLAGAGYVNGVMTDAPSNAYPTVITPAGYAFSIWGLIYLGLLAFAIYQATGERVRRLANLRTPVLVSCLLNCVWLFFWHRFEMAACAGIIVALALTLLLIVLKSRSPVSGMDAVMTKGVFGIYAGWVTCASIVNIAIALKYMNVSLGDREWMFGVGAIILAGIIAVAVRVYFRNYMFPMAVAWAVTAIAVKQSGNTPIVVAAAVCVIVCLIAAASFVMDRPAAEPHL